MGQKTKPGWGGDGLIWREPEIRGSGLWTASYRPSGALKGL